MDKYPGLFLTFSICFTFCIIIKSTSAGPLIEINNKQLDINEQEKAALDQFRSLAAEIIKDNKYMQTDSYLIRWVRDQNLNPQKAYEKFVNHLQYRKFRKLDEIINEDFSVLRRSYPFDTNGRDTSGRPILAWPLGAWDIRKAALASKLDQISRYVDYMIESTAVAARNSRSKSGDSMSQAVIIMDLTGFNVRQHACLSCLPLYVDMISKLETNYPQSIKSFYIINTPKIFTRILDVVLPAASEATKKTIKVFGYNKSEWSKELLETIGVDQLSRKYGGTKV